MIAPAWLTDLVDEYRPPKQDRAWSERHAGRIRRLAQSFAGEAPEIMTAAVAAYMRQAAPYFPKVSDLAPFVDQALKAQRAAVDQTRTPNDSRIAHLQLRQRWLGLDDAARQGEIDPAAWSKLAADFIAHDAPYSALHVIERYRRLTVGRLEIGLDAAALKPGEGEPDPDIWLFVIDAAAPAAEGDPDNLIISALPMGSPMG